MPRIQVLFVRTRSLRSRLSAAPLALLALLLGACPLRAAVDSDALEPYPNMAQSVGEVLDKSYYDHRRFLPHVMVERALRALEQSEMSVAANWENGAIVLTVGDATAKRIAAPEPAEMMDAMAIIESVRTAIDAVDSFTPEHRRDLDYILVNGALTTLDPHTVLMPPEPAREFGEEIHGEFYGIGAYLITDDGVISIERTMPGLPADKAGVEDGDVILCINNEKTAGLSLDQAVHRIKGPKGSTVQLTIERKGAKNPIELPIVRDLVQVVSTRSFRSGDVGYIRMDDFSSNTAHELFDAIQDLDRGGQMSALVLDLRFNGGGLLEAAKNISQFFLPRKSEIVRTVTVDGVPDIDRSSSPPILGDVPMVVLVSGGSASAAEILSGALQRNDRAVIAGTVTFGKGSVQKIESMPAGAKLKLTIQEYQLPGGVSIQDSGITPDLELVRHSVLKDGTVDLVPYSREREVDDEFALKNTARYQHDSTYQLGWVAPYLSRDQAKAFSIAARDFHPDQEAMLVVDLLQNAITKAGAGPFLEAATTARKQNHQRQALLDMLKDPISSRSESESQNLAGILKKVLPTVSWGPAAAPSPGALTMQYAGPAMVQAGRTEQLRFTVHNAGPKVVGRLYGVVNADRMSPLWEDEVVVGEVAPGKDAQATLSFQVPPRLYDGDEHFTVDLFCDAQGTPIASVPVEIAVRGQPRGVPSDAVDPASPVSDAALRPHFSYSWKLEQGPSGNQLQPGDSGIVDLTLKNDGDAPSAKIKLYVFKSDDPYVQLGEVRFPIEAGLAPGAEVTEKVPVMVLKEVGREGEPKPFQGDHVKLQIRAEESFEDAKGEEEVSGIYRASLYSTLSIPVNQPVVGATVVQPEISLAEVTSLPNHQVRLRVRIADDPAQLHLVALFLGEDKIDLEPASKLIHLPQKTRGGEAVAVYQSVITLKPGLNDLKVVASNTNEVSEVLPLRLWGPAAPGHDPADPGQLGAPGQRPAYAALSRPAPMLERPRRNRRTPAIRSLVAETSLAPSDLILPLFIQEGGGSEPIASMPGVLRHGIDSAVAQAHRARDLGIRALALFPRIAAEGKDASASAALDPAGLVPRALARLRAAVPDLVLITDVAMDPYSIHGHDGVVQDGEVDNDATLPLLAAMAVAQARAGADVVAPSDMMDGRVRAIREALDQAGFTGVLILSYCAKYASHFYGAFRDALDSAPRPLPGVPKDKRGYQMDPANREEALREAALDLAEGADMLMVKPGLPYLDVIHALRAASTLPIAAYQVSGEYAMLRAAAERGWLDYQSCLLESLLALRRAGADMILSYGACDAAAALTSS